MNNFVYLYEDSFEELLYTLYYLIQNKIRPMNIQSESTYVANLFDSPFKVKQTNFSSYDYFIKRFGKEIMGLARDVYLSSHEKKELILYYFFVNACKYPDTILQRRNLKCVNAVLNISHYVHRETHKMKGFLRFQEMKNGFLYAKIETENFILFALAYHFKKRMPMENFVIQDMKRGVYAFYDTKNLYFLNEDQVKELSFDFSEQEMYMEELWKTFFHTIAIPERENRKCQRNFMPKKYWKYLIEMEEIS